MRLVGFVLMVAMALGAMGVGASAATLDSSASSPAVDGVALPVQMSTGANADTVAPTTSAPTVAVAVPPGDQVNSKESDKREKKKIRVSLNYYGFFPRDSETRDNFGQVWGSIGIGLFRPERPNKWAFAWDATFLTKNGTSKALLIPVTVGAERGLGKDPDWQPYFAVRVGPFYGKVDNSVKGPDASKIGLTANFALGSVIHQKYLLEARYDWFPSIAGNDLDGFTVTLGVKVLQFSL